MDNRQLFYYNFWVYLITMKYWNDYVVCLLFEVSWLQLINKISSYFKHICKIIFNTLIFSKQLEQILLRCFRSISVSKVGDWSCLGKGNVQFVVFMITCNITKKSNFNIELYNPLKFVKTCLVELSVIFSKNDKITKSIL